MHVLFSCALFVIVCRGELPWVGCVLCFRLCFTPGFLIFTPLVSMTMSAFVIHAGWFDCGLVVVVVVVAIGTWFLFILVCCCVVLGVCTLLVRDGFRLERFECVFGLKFSLLACAFVVDSCLNCLVHLGQASNTSRGPDWVIVVSTSSS